MKQKAYVRIGSNVTIQVTCGLQNKDVTNPDAHVADRLKVSPKWPRCSVIIKQGSYLYPSEITEWPTVKALANDKVITIGEFTDNVEEDKEVENVKNKLTIELNKLNDSKEQTNNKVEEANAKINEIKTKLSDIAGE